MQELSFELRGLNCANCAAKIEDEVNRLDCIDSATLVFASQKINIKIKESTSTEEIHSMLSSIVKNHEPNVKVLPVNQSSNKASIVSGLAEYKKQIIFLAAGILLYAAGLSIGKGTVFELPLFLAAYFACGYDVLLQAGRNILKGRVFDENFLMGIATAGAFAIGEYPEAAGVMLFFKIGELLQGLAVNKSRRSIKTLLDLKPEFANLKTDDGIIRIEPENLKIGDVIVIRPGERVPSDCVVIEGNSYLDTSSLTGESVPRSAGPGDRILGGFVNNNGLLSAKVDTVLKEAAISRILDLVENAAARKAPVENFISKFAAWYTPAVVSLAAITAIVPPLVTGNMDFSLWIYKALIFLVISCPCALVISVPLTFFAGIGLASSKGILVKGSNYLEALAEADTFVFDKTGTLTQGTFKVTDIKAAAGHTENQLLEYAATAETHSSHPAARALLEAYGALNGAPGTCATCKPGEADESSTDKALSIDIGRITSCEEIAGMGVKTVIDGKTVLAGSKKLLEREGVTGVVFEALQGTAVHVAVDSCYAGLITISDVLKNDAVSAVESLRGIGAAKVVMLTGDGKAAARNIADQLKLDSVYSELLPHQKAEVLEKIKASASGKVVFTGDGINDAPVLALADIGVSMGSIGSDAAIEASDIVLMTDEPSKLAEAVKIAGRTRRIAWQNIIFALSVKAVIMIMSFIGMSTMWEAVFADVGVTLLAVFNSLRILYNPRR